MSKEYSPRLTVELTAEQAEDLRNLLPWGVQRGLFSMIVDDVIEILKSPKGSIMLAFILSEGLKPRAIFRTLKEATKERERGEEDGNY